MYRKMKIERVSSNQMNIHGPFRSSLSLGLTFPILEGYLPVMTFINKLGTNKQEPAKDIELPVAEESRSNMSLHCI